MTTMVKIGFSRRIRSILIIWTFRNGYVSLGGIYVEISKRQLRYMHVEPEGISGLNYGFKSHLQTNLIKAM